MKQKLAIAASFINNPKILILDEPLDGLDPVAINVYKKIIQRFRDEKGSVIYSSHIMEIVESLSNKIIILNGGKIVYQGDNKQSKELKNLSEIFDDVTPKVDYDKMIDEIFKNLNE